LAEPGARAMSIDAWKSSLPFSFTYGGRNSSDFLRDWIRSQTVASSPGGRVITFVFKDPASRLKVSAELRTFNDFDALEWVLRFTNEGRTDSPILENIEPLDWTFSPPSGACILHHAKGSNAKVNDFEPLDDPLGPGTAVTLGSKNGRSSDTNTLPFFNLQTGDGGVIGAVGWTGNWAARFSLDKAGKSLTATAGMTKTHFLLHPGESVRTPRILLLNWSGGDWQASQNLWRRLVLSYYSPLGPDRKAINVPYCLGTWGAESIDSKIAWVRSLKENQVPFDVYWIDAGWFGNEAPKSGPGPDMDVLWYRNRGTWTPNTTTYPHGFKPLGDLLRESGYGFLLWFEAETADPGSELRTRHPDWFLQVPKAVNPGVALLDLGNPEARKGITDLVSRMITDGGVTWYRQDFNIPSGPYWAIADAPDRVGIAEIKHVTGLYQMWDDLRAQHPGLQIDNCSSGGRRLDLEMMSRSVSLWRTDYECTLFDPIGGQRETQGLVDWVPLNAGNYGGITPGAPRDGPSVAYAFRSNYSAGLVVNPGDRGTEGALSLDMMKTVGQEFLEVRPYFTGDFYALVPYSAAPDAWAVWQFDRPDLNAGIVLYFRRQGSSRASAQPGLSAIDPGARYDVEVRTGFEKGTVTSMSGRELADIQVGIANAPGSALLLYRRR
jgi:alpha-galactosidase